MSKKSCKKGYYYCNTDEKCKKIPRGYILGIGGYLRKEKGDDSDEETKNNGNGNGGNGNGNHSNGNGNGNGSSSDGGGEGGGGGVSEAWSAKYKKSIDCDNPKGFSQKAHCGGREKVSEGKNGDHEVAMAQSQLKKSAANITKLRKALGKKEKDIPAWMQAKITDTAHDTDAAAGYADKMNESKSGDSSLRDWFGKSKSSDGKPGWVQLGGKYAGKPCAKQPGQKTKPKCGSSKMAANLDAKEEKKAFNRKQRQDPNPNRKGKAINVKTESYSNWREESKPIDEGAANVIRAGLAIGTGLAGLELFKKAKQVGEKVKTRNQKMQDAINKARGVKEEVISERDAWGTGPRDMIRMGGGSLKSPQDLERERLERLKKLKPGVKLDKAHYEPEGEIVDEGKKDACYHKVKSRYSVWPSAYASGALVKCRKKGAANWGNKTKKESYEISNWRDDFQALEYESVDIIKAEPLQATQGIGSDMLDEKCWKGYEKKGMKTMFGKRYPNCVKKKKTRKEEVELTEAPYKRPADGAGRANSTPPPGVSHADDSHVFPNGDVIKPGTTIDGSRNAAQAEREKAAKKRRQQVRMGTLNRIIKDNPKNWDFSNENVEKRMMTGESSNWRSELDIQEDWQKSNRKDGVDGMSQKSVNAYKRENPGSKLKTAVTGNPKKGSKDAKRRSSYCSRSKGQMKMHNIDCSKTPDKKICKARRRWKC